MQIDKKTLNRLLSLNDDQLRLLLRKLMTQYGLDASLIPLEQMDMARLREIVGQATDEDIARFLQLVGAGSKKGGGQ